MVYMLTDIYTHMPLTILWSFLHIILFLKHPRSSITTPSPGPHRYRCPDTHRETADRLMSCQWSRWQSVCCRGGQAHERTSRWPAVNVSLASCSGPSVCPTLLRLRRSSWEDLQFTLWSFLILEGMRTAGSEAPHYRSAFIVVPVSCPSPFLLLCSTSSLSHHPLCPSSPHPLLSAAVLPSGEERGKKKEKKKTHQPQAVVNGRAPVYTHMHARARIHTHTPGYAYGFNLFTFACTSSFIHSRNKRLHEHSHTSALLTTVLVCIFFHHCEEQILEIFVKRLIEVRTSQQKLSHC